MEVKKNPNVDPKRNSTLYFQIGLAAVLLLTYIGIELKSEMIFLLEILSKLLDILDLASSTNTFLFFFTILFTLELYFPPFLILFELESKSFSLLNVS